MFKNKYSLFLVLIFIISRVCFYLAGGRFDVTTLYHYNQIIDPSFLQSQLLRSIFYLHMQPPFFNFFLGIVLKIFPNGYLFVFTFVYIFLGLVLALSMFRLMIKMGVKETIAFLLAVYFILSPSAFFYENLLFYEYPVACFLLLSALFLYKYFEDHRPRNIFVFVGLTACLVLTREIFSPPWYILIAGVIVFLKKHEMRRIILVFGTGLLLIAGVCLKNYILFKKFSVTSQMIGYYFAHMVFFGTPTDKIHELENAGKISRITDSEIGDDLKIGMFVYQHIPVKETGVPVLDEFTKPLSGDPNFNSLYHLLTAQIYFKDTVAVLFNYPQAYWRGIKLAFTFYPFPGPTDMPMINRPVLEKYENMYNFMFFHLNQLNNNEL